MTKSPWDIRCELGSIAFCFIKNSFDVHQFRSISRYGTTVKFKMTTQILTAHSVTISFYIKYKNNYRVIIQ